MADMIIRMLVLFLVLSLCQGCGSIFKNPLDWFDSGGGGDGRETLPDRVSDPNAKYAIAVGGVAEGVDEITLPSSNVVCESDSDILSISVTGETMQLSAA